MRTVIRTLLLSKRTFGLCAAMLASMTLQAGEGALKCAGNSNNCNNECSVNSTTNCSTNCVLDDCSGTTCGDVGMTAADCSGNGSGGDGGNGNGNSCDCGSPSYGYCGEVWGECDYDGVYWWSSEYCSETYTYPNPSSACTSSDCGGGSQACYSGDCPQGSGGYTGPFRDYNSCCASMSPGGCM